MGGVSRIMPLNSPGGSTLQWSAGSFAVPDSSCFVYCYMYRTNVTSAGLTWSGSKPIAMTKVDIHRETPTTAIAFGRGPCRNSSDPMNIGIGPKLLCKTRLPYYYRQIVRYTKVGNYYYYSIAVTSLSLNLFTYVISIASAGLGTPASLQHAGKTVKFRAARNVYCIVSDHSSASIRCVKTCMIIGLDDQRSTCKDVVQCVRTKEHSAVDVHRVRM